MTDLRPARSVVSTAAIAALPIVTLCLFIPLQIYAGNTDEFNASFVSIVTSYLPYALALIGILSLVGVTMTQDGLRRYHAILAAVAILAWLQGNILVWDYGALDGQAIDWYAGKWRGVIDTSIWVLLLVIAISRFQRFGRILKGAALFAVGIQLGTAAITTSRAWDSLLAAPDSVAVADAAEEIFRFSDKGNVVHIVMDGFQTDIFSEIVSDSQNADYRDALGGFTLFSNNVGVYPYTQLTVPALLTGKIFRNEEPVEQFIDAALEGPTILRLAAEHGYEVDIAAPIGLKNKYAKAPHTHAYGISQSDHVRQTDRVVVDAAKLLDIALFRSVPHFAKALVYRDQLWVFQTSVNDESYLHMQFFSDLAFLDQLAHRMSVGRNAPVYKMMHLMLSHRPTVGNEHCKFDGIRATNRENVTMQARCGLSGVFSVLRRMRELGIYDNSLIVLMADHGAWVPVESGGQVDTALGTSPTNIAMAIPVLAIKPPGAGGPMQSSDAATSVIDIPATIADLLELPSDFPGTTVFAKGANEKRRHLTYAYGNNPEFDGYLFTMQEYEISGSPFEPDAWRPVATHRPGHSSNTAN